VVVAATVVTLANAPPGVDSSKKKVSFAVTHAPGKVIVLPFTVAPLRSQVEFPVGVHTIPRFEPAVPEPSLLQLRIPNESVEVEEVKKGGLVRPIVI
jgi:hypothetical protein